MARRFDVATYRAEAAGWNVEKLVNVAAATGRHSIDETLEIERRAEVDGHPTPSIGGVPPTDSVAEAVALIDRQMAASRFRGVRPMGALEGPLPRRRRARARCRSEAWCSSCWPAPISSRPRPPGSPAIDDLVVVVEHTGWPRSDSDEERALWQAGIEALAAARPERALQAVRAWRCRSGR